mmetsp:Transcript_36083/g.67209  ORF Transcript_36083/g.67209 Transcript_36083/m.67209 type:complete len:269 (-) Transcript_36083:52-858(-)
MAAAVAGVLPQEQEARAEASEGIGEDGKQVQSEGKDGQTVEVRFESKKQLSKALRQHRSQHVVVTVPDVVDMMATLQGKSRQSVLQGAISSWFTYATGFPVLEVECHEQRQQLEGDMGALLVFRVKLDALYDAEAAKLKKREELNSSFRNKLVNALPEDLVKAKGDKLQKMVQISWTQPGSIVLGGVAALSLVVLIISAIGMTRCSCDCCTCLTLCACMRRSSRRESDVYFCAISELQKRGATFDVLPDGSSTLHVPPLPEYAFCTIV